MKSAVQGCEMWVKISTVQDILVVALAAWSVYSAKNFAKFLKNFAKYLSDGFRGLNGTAVNRWKWHVPLSGL